MNFKTKAEELVNLYVSGRLLDDKVGAVRAITQALEQAYQAGYSTRRRETNSGRLMYLSGFKDGKLEAIQDLITAMEEGVEEKTSENCLITGVPCDHIKCRILTPNEVGSNETRTRMLKIANEYKDRVC